MNKFESSVSREGFKQLLNIFFEILVKTIGVRMEYVGKTNFTMIRSRELTTELDFKVLQKPLNVIKFGHMHHNWQH